MFSKSMKKFAKITLLMALIVIIGYLVYAFFTGTFPFGGTGPGDGEAETPANISLEEESEIVDEPDIVIEPPPPVIEVSEDRIIFSGEEISMEDLEEVLRRYAGLEEVWELHDLYRADRATYEKVRELLRTHDIAYRLR